MIYTIGDALVSLKPNAEWSMVGTEYSDITWLDKSQTKPTEAEVTAEIERLNNGYETKRAAEYPSVVDQLDKMFHSGFQAWKDEIQIIKEKYPKP